MGSNRDNFMLYLLLVLDIYSTSNTRHFFQIDHIKMMCVSVSNIYLLESVCIESLQNEKKNIKNETKMRTHKNECVGAKAYTLLECVSLSTW